MNLPFVFFGTDNFSTIVLGKLEEAGFLPKAVVTAPDRKKGRGLQVAEPEVKKWAVEKNIPVLQFERLDDIAIEELKKLGVDLFVVASYGLIIPQAILDIPTKGALNVHPSLLPKYRGASPIQSAILAGDGETGVSIMLMDAKVDHGPILRQQEFIIYNFKFLNEIPKATELEKKLADMGGKLLAEILPKWVSGEIKAMAQDDAVATYTQKIAKADGEIRLEDDPWQNFLKIRALDSWPGSFFYIEKSAEKSRPPVPNGYVRAGTERGITLKKIRIIIKDAEFRDGKLALTRVLPEGGKEMGWEEFERGYLQKNL